MDEEKPELGAAEPDFLSRMKDHGEGLSRKVLATQVTVLSGLSATRSMSYWMQCMPVKPHSYSVAKGLIPVAERRSNQRFGDRRDNSPHKPCAKNAWFLIGGQIVGLPSVRQLVRQLPSERAG